MEKLNNAIKELNDKVVKAADFEFTQKDKQKGDTVLADRTWEANEKEKTRLNDLLTTSKKNANRLNQEKQALQVELE